MSHFEEIFVSENQNVMTVIATHVQIRRTFSENQNVMIRHMIIIRSNRYARSDSAYFLSPAPPSGAVLDI